MRRRSMNRSTVLVIASLTTMFLSGCGKDLPTAPSIMSDPGVSKAPVRPSAATSTSSYTWTQLVSQWVNKGEAATVSGGRYKVQFVRGGLGQGATIVISERDPSVPDVVIGPSGTVLSKAATLTISYAGTAGAVSPTMLKLYRLNDSTGGWEVVAATNDVAGQTITAKVSVLCRYAVSTGDPTKAGW
jgi:hypothetical protein